jgi:predicted MarR family transcription regulator
MNTNIINILNQNTGETEIRELCQKLSMLTKEVHLSLVELEAAGFISTKKNKSNSISTSKLTAKGHSAAISGENVNNLGLNKQLFLYTKCFRQEFPKLY